MSSSSSLQLLASSALDTKSKSKRAEAIRQCDEEYYYAAAESLASLEGFDCRSDHAVRRVSDLYCRALGVSSSGENTAQLCSGLCRVLIQASSSTSSSILEACVKELSKESSNDRRETLVKALESIAADDSETLYAPALSLASGLSSSSDDNNTERYVELFLQRAFDKFASIQQVCMFQSVLMKVSQQSIYNNHIQPMLIRKLRANPEKAIMLVEWVVGSLPRQQLNICDQLTNDWMPTLLKLLKSSSHVCRELTQSLLIHLALLQQPQATRIVCTTLSNALLTTLSQADQREAVYVVLEKVGQHLVEGDTTTTTDYSSVLSNLTTVLHKESNKLVKEVGLKALCCWLVICKRNHGSSDNGYEEAIKFLQNPLVDGNSTETLTILGTLASSVYEDILESITLDLWSNKKVDKGIQSILEGASKKHAASSAVAPVEGLVVVYLALVHAYAAAGQLDGLASCVSKVLSAGSAANKTSSSSFLYSKTMTDAVKTNRLVGQLLPRVISMYAKLLGKQETVGSVKLFDKESAACRALACCVAYPPSCLSSQAPTEAILSSVKTVLTYHPSAADCLVSALLQHVNELSLQYEETRKAQIFSKEARVAEATEESSSQQHRSMDSNTIRRVALMLAQNTTEASSLATACVLMHTGTTAKSAKRQRQRLISNLCDILQTIVLPWIEDRGEDDVVPPMARLISELACCQKQNGEENSEAMHRSALSMIMSLGGIASSFDPAFDDPDDNDMKLAMFARKFCTDGLAPTFAMKLDLAMEAVEGLTVSDVALYKSPDGTLFRETTDNDSDGMAADKMTAQRRKMGGKSRRAKGDFGAGLEEEEWERQIKKELAAKKKSSGISGSTALSQEEKELVAKQDMERRRVGLVVDGDFKRTLSSIETLCLSDIEVGNAILPVLHESVLKSAVTDCSAYREILQLKTLAQDALSTLANGVYEIEDSHASSIALASIVCCRIDASSQDTEDSTRQIKVIALPSPCASAAVVISEMDDFLDQLSGPSFAFLFPIIRAALTGPRTTPGCEAALRVLDRHTLMLDGEDEDPFVSRLRKEMVESVLELLSHDRSQTFVDPTPVEALVNCYQTGTPEESNHTPALNTQELAPLLDERGALGTRNCRLASMVTIGSIAEMRSELAKGNPLIENRVWLNCFEADENIQKAARSTWMTLGGLAGGEAELASLPPPSVLYAVPLLPLLDHSNPDVASAAARAYAHAMGRHPSSAERSIIKLCTHFIESYPTESSDSRKSNLPVPLPSKISTAPAAKKTAPSISTGLPKKKIVKKKSALAVAGIGQPKPRTTKKKAVSSALLKPKEERTLDSEFLESQFRAEKKTETAEKDSPRKVDVRLGVLKAIASLTEATAEVALELPALEVLVSFLVAYGLADGNDGVREAARNALRDIVASDGDSEEAIAFLLPLFESVLNTGQADEGSLGELESAKVPRDIAASDRRKEGVVVALGSVALHLKGDDSEAKVDSTIDMLLGALKTPSESVQSSVASALAKLMKKGRTQDRIEDILSSLMGDCLHGDSLATRRGAAYGISAAVKGSGIASLKKYEIVKQLEQACSSGASNNKEGALFAIELLSERLGLLFEPYVIVLLPSLLKSFSDNSDYVRSAADNTVSIIMGKLSAHGVKLILPAVLSAFEHSAWRTKVASIHMLGSMSHLAPKQLASALPKVVPKLTEAFSDTHPKVKASAEEALGEISKVIKNPEVSSISSALLKALTDPSEYTVKALEALIGTEFLHAIDAPSLALIVPVLHRGLRDRAATTKRYGALIAGNICTMINDPRDFVPYLPILLPDLQAAVLDPIPDVRSTSAKALGSLTRGLGEETLPDLRSWLIIKLRDDNLSSAERSGAAQGLTEVLVACGTEVVESVMVEDILPLKSHPQASTREGVLWVLTFLPPTLGQAFTPLIDSSLPALLGGLSDDSELVRDVAMRAGRVLIRSHGKVHVDKILPSIESGLKDEDYRIRVASLTMLGDLLSLIGGTSVVKGDGETQDDIRRAERAQAQIALVLGSETRKRILSELYMARSDTAAIVRQSAVQVWKTIVSVTARALRDILKVLVGQIVDALASGHPERTQVAGRCLGDVVHKLGDSVLPEIIPVLRNALYTGDPHTRQGVCVGLSEVIRSSTKDQILRFLEIIVKVVQDALCDEDEGVRKMAASCFQSLHSLVGNRAMDEIVPSLLVALEETGDEQARTRALNGLTGILSIRSRELLPYIIPRLISCPITVNHAKALSGIAAVTGATLYTHFSAIIPALLADLSQISTNKDGDDERKTTVQDCARSICRNAEEAGVNWMISEIASKSSSDKAELRRESCWMFGIAVEERKDKQDFYEQIPIILRELLYRLNDENPSVVKAAHSAFTSLSKHVPAEELVKHIEFVRNLIASIVSEARHRKGGVGDGEFLLPGFNMPKGLEPLLPIYQRGILYGNSTIREVSAAGLGEVIKITSSKFLAGPLIIKITGPLLRIVGDRNPSNVKIAILRTLGLILVKGGPALRAFVPQFQTTFVKALSDPSRQVRVEAIQALALLMPLATRVDPLLKELVSGSLGKSVGAADETAVAAVQTASLEALAVVLEKGGSKAKMPDSIPAALDAAKELLNHDDEGVREAAAKVMGNACELVGLEVTTATIRNDVLRQSDTSAEVRHGKACACHRILASSIGAKLEENVMSDLLKLIVSYMHDDKGIVKEAACVAIGALVGSSSDDAGRLRSMEPEILEILRNKKETIDVHRAMARGLCLMMHLSTTKDRISFLGKTIVDECLQLAMSGSQRVQYAYNDVLWMVLKVDEGEEGLETYMQIATFDNTKAMKSLYSKVLTGIKQVNLD